MGVGLRLEGRKKDLCMVSKVNVCSAANSQRRRIEKGHFFEDGLARRGLEDFQAEGRSCLTAIKLNAIVTPRTSVRRHKRRGAGRALRKQPTPLSIAIVRRACFRGVCTSDV